MNITIYCWSIRRRRLYPLSYALAPPARFERATPWSGTRCAIPCATGAYVAEPGAGPGMPRRLLYRQLSVPTLTSAGCATAN
jgi:hypothetical protein